MTAPKHARRPATPVEVRCVAWHPNPEIAADLAARPAGTMIVFADDLCQCGRQFLDATDADLSGHDGRTVFEDPAGMLFGSPKCAGAYFDGGPDDRGEPAPVPSARELALEGIVREFVAARSGPTSWADDEVLFVRAQMLVGGAA
ncbi:hypothetical protein [Catenuloplanes japonicus]|uniref:hypothetical protein n=1 Tax=Catenuloplanes japonicus TaxID=33876 RepID=UPI000524192F|nr:hypothetical protein [Catenuloplanes japonicus]